MNVWLHHVKTEEIVPINGLTFLVTVLNGLMEQHAKRVSIHIQGNFSLGVVIKFCIYKIK